MVAAELSSTVAAELSSTVATELSSTVARLNSPFLFWEQSLVARRFAETSEIN